MASGGNFNAIAGAVLASVLGVMAIGIGAGTIFHDNNYPEHPGFSPDISAITTESSGGPAAPAGPPDFGRLFADAAQLQDMVSRGGNLVGQCKSCHTFEAGEPNRIGPNLHDVFGRHAASHPGFDYSDGMKGHNVTWSYLTLNDFLTSPGTVVRGTKMTFAGIRRTEDRVAVIAYLRSISPNNEPLPSPLPEAPAAGTETGASTATTGATTPAGQQPNPPTTGTSQPAPAAHH